jgi:sugar phosphate isomerase/epimerase
MAPAGSPPPIFRLRFLPRLTEGVRDLVPADLADRLRRRERDRRIAARGAGWLFADLPAERLAAFEEDLRRLIGVARRIGARPILMSHAHRFGDDPAPDDPWVAEWLRYAPRATRATLLAFDAAGGRATLRVAADSGIPGVDLPALIGGDTTAFVDFSHFTDQGAGRVASILGDAIRAAVSSCAPESDD